MRKVIVCGGRNYRDRAHAFNVLDMLAIRSPGGQVFVIHGGMTGLDFIAGQWAEHRGMPCAVVRAQWNKFNRAAGPKRNRWMLLLGPDEVIAFPGGAGTADMTAAAREAGVPVRSDNDVVNAWCGTKAEPREAVR